MPTSMSAQCVNSHRVARLNTSRPMDAAMSTRVAKRFEDYWIWGMLSLVVVLSYHFLSLALVRTNILSGVFLYFLLLSLALFSVRKKVPFLPLGTAAGWLKFHIYCGLFSVLLFALHIGVGLPNGNLEVSLAIVYLGVVGSGIVGLGLSIWIPKQLANCGEEVIFERIPILQRNLREEAEGLVASTGNGEPQNFTSATCFLFLKKRTILIHIFLIMIEHAKNFSIISEPRIHFLGHWSEKVLNN